jgi:hypothetical protein
VGEQARHEFAGPRRELGTRAAPEHGADCGGLQRAAIGAADCKARRRRKRERQPRESLWVLAQEAREIRQQRVVPGERAIEIEQGQRPAGPGGDWRWRRLQVGQAALPATASCRSTYCRIPPWR